MVARMSNRMMKVNKMRTVSENGEFAGGWVAVGVDMLREGEVYLESTACLFI